MSSRRAHLASLDVPPIPSRHLLMDIGGTLPTFIHIWRAAAAGGGMRDASGGMRKRTSGDGMRVAGRRQWTQKDDGIGGIWQQGRMGWSRRRIEVPVAEMLARRVSHLRMKMISCPMGSDMTVRYRINVKPPPTTDHHLVLPRILPQTPNEIGCRLVSLMPFESRV